MAEAVNRWFSRDADGSPERHLEGVAAVAINDIMTYDELEYREMVAWDPVPDHACTRGLPMPERLLTLTETAEYLRLSPGALYTQRYRGEKPGALGIRVGRRLLFRPSDIDQFLDERLEESELATDWWD